MSRNNPNVTNAVNALLAAGVHWAYGPLFIAAPNQYSQGNRIFGYRTTNCGAVGIWDIFEETPEGYFTFPSGAEFNGRGEFLATTQHGEDEFRFYNFNRLPLSLQPVDNPLATAPAEEFYGDIAIGSDF